MKLESLNPYFTGLPILIAEHKNGTQFLSTGFNPYFTGLPILIASTPDHEDVINEVSILILLDYLFL